MKSLLKPPQWIENEGPEADIVLSSRIRLARNLKSFPFPQKASREERSGIIEKIKNIMVSNYHFSDYNWLYMDQLSPLDRQILVEEHIISPNFSQESASGRAICYNLEKSESIMVNEEDHIRLQVIEPGFNLSSGWIKANNLDDQIEGELDYAFSQEFGYKTSCPTNMGTALRASVMIHLPAIGNNNALKGLSDYISQLGLQVRGIFGEGSNVLGHMIQISNIVSHNSSEEGIFNNIERIIRYIIQRERDLSEKMLYDTRPKTEDMVYRNFALLKSARILTMEEFMNSISVVRMGVNMNILPTIRLSTLNRLMIITRPAYIQKYYESFLSQEQIDICRAQLVREQLSQHSL